MVVVDARGLLPPEPFERALAALVEMVAGDRMRLLIDREPHPLLRMLERNRFRYRIDRVDDHFEIEIWLPGPP